MRVPIGTLGSPEALHTMRNRVARKHIPQKEDGPGLYEKLKKEEPEEDPEEGGGSMPKKTKKAKKAKKAKIF